MVVVDNRICFIPFIANQINPIGLHQFWNQMLHRNGRRNVKLLGSSALVGEIMWHVVSKRSELCKTSGCLVSKNIKGELKRKIPNVAKVFQKRKKSRWSNFGCDTIHAVLYCSSFIASSVPATHRTSIIEIVQPLLGLRAAVVHLTIVSHSSLHFSFTWSRNEYCKSLLLLVPALLTFC